MDVSPLKQGGDLAQTLSCIRHDEPSFWLPADFSDKQKTHDSEDIIAAEANKTGWNMVPWCSYPSGPAHYAAQHFGIGLGHELYDSLERELSKEAFSRRSKTHLLGRCNLKRILSDAAINAITWKDLLSIAVLVYIARKYYESHGNKQMTEFEKRTRRRLTEEEQKRAADKAAKQAEEAARRERWEVPPPRELPWLKPKTQVSAPRPAPAVSRLAAARDREGAAPTAIPYSPAPATSGNKRHRAGSPDEHRAEAVVVAKRARTGFSPEPETPGEGRWPSAAKDLGTQVTTSTLCLFLSHVLKDPKRRSFTVRELLAFVGDNQSPTL